MFAPKGPRSRRPGANPDASLPPRGPASVTETVVIEAAPRRRLPKADAPGRQAAIVAKRRLVDLGSDWLATILALSNVPELPDPAALRARALDLKSRFEREAGEQGFTASDTDDAVFALVAFLDETVLNNRGAAREAWIARPLQLELYNRQLAGEEFFERLERLRKDRESRIEALEMYACCLAFGFAGRMRLGPPEKLASLLDDVLRDVAAARGSTRMPLAPNAGRRQERVADEARGLPWWLAPALLVPAIVIGFLLIWLLASIGAGHTASHLQNLVSR